jgi:hypothetical protein
MFGRKAFIRRIHELEEQLVDAEYRSGKWDLRTATGVALQLEAKKRSFGSMYLHGNSIDMSWRPGMFREETALESLRRRAVDDDAS